MHVMQLCSGRTVNGAVIHCWLLSQELRKLGHQVTLACRPDSWIAGQAEAAGFDVVRTEFGKFSAGQLRDMKGELLARGVDVMHSHQSSASCFAVVLRCLAGKPSVATAHSRYLQVHWMWNDFVIGVSDSTTRYHQRVNLVAPRRSATVHNFVDWNRFQEPDATARRRLRAEWGVADDQLLFGPVGDIIARKGLLHLVRALPQIRGQHPRAKLICVGGAAKEPQYLARVKAEAERLGVADSILWTGPRRDIPQVLSAMDLFVLPSLEECFPLSILEAMAMGLPCVASDVGGIGECVVDRQTGLLAPAAQPRPLAQAISHLLDDETTRRQFGQAGRRRVLECFTPASQAPKIADILQQTAAARRAAA